MTDEARAETRDGNDATGIERAKEGWWVGGQGVKERETGKVTREDES